MSSAAGPSIATSGLVLDIDMSNTQKSWKGVPTTNYYKYSATFDDFAYANRTIVTDYLPNGTYSSCLINTFDQASGSRFFIDFTANSNGVYTCSYWVKLVGGSTATNTTLNVKDYQTDVVRGTSGTITLTSSWQRISATGATSGATAGLRFEINVNTSGAAAKIQLYGGQVEQLLFASPLVPTSGAIASRSNTQAIVDLTGNNTLTATSLTYASDNTFSFNGSNNYLTINNFPTKPTTAITCEAWIKPTKSVLTGTIRGGAISATNSMYLGIIDSIDGGVTHALHWANQTSVSRVTSWNGNIPNNAWSHIIGTYDGAIMKAYINGTEVYSAAQTGTITDATYVIGTYGGALQDGVHNFNGLVPVSKIYNRALSAAEVQQNFNATRSRYGI